MSKKRYQSASNAYVPALPDELEQPAPLPVRIVHAGNEPSRPGMIVIAFLIFLIPVLVIAAAVWRLTGGELTVTLIVIAAGAFYVGKIAVIVANGDWVADREIKRAYDLEEKRLKTQERAYTRRLLIEQEHNQHRHAERMAEIQVNVDVSAIHSRLRLLEERPAESATSPPPPAYVPAVPTQARRMVLAYLLGEGDRPGLYLPHGPLDRKRVAQDGRITSRVPWSARGEWRGADAQHAMDLIAHPSPGAEPLIIEERSGNRATGYYVNEEHYPTRADVLRILGAG